MGVNIYKLVIRIVDILFMYSDNLVTKQYNDICSKQYELTKSRYFTYKGEFYTPTHRPANYTYSVLDNSLYTSMDNYLSLSKQVNDTKKELRSLLINSMYTNSMVSDLLSLLPEVSSDIVISNTNYKLDKITACHSNEHKKRIHEILNTEYVNSLIG